MIWPPTVIGLVHLVNEQVSAVLAKAAHRTPDYSAVLGVELILFLIAAGIVAAIIYGGVKWRKVVLTLPELDASERLQNKDAVVVLTQSLVVVVVCIYIAVAAAAVCFPNRWSAMGIVAVWAMAALSVGWILGFLFGHPKIEENVTVSNGRLRSVRSNTSLDQVIDWLTKAIVGVGLVESQRILRWGNDLATKIGKGLACLMEGGCEETGFALAAAVLLVFPILGFLVGYLVTRTYVVLALCRAEVAATDAANPDWESEQAKFEISDDEFRKVDQAELMLDDGNTEASGRLKEALEKVSKHPLKELQSWRHIRLWAKAKVMLALQGDFPELAREAEDGFQKALELVPNDAETRLGLAIALSLQDGKKREVLSELEAARDSLMAKSGDDLWKNVYKSLTFQYLYLPEPESFQKTLSVAREYFRRDGTIPSGGIWVNVACAYGLAAKWLQDDPSRDIDLTHLDVFAPSSTTNPIEGSKIEWLKAMAVKAAKEALGRDPKWKTKLRWLAGLDGNQSTEKDLAVVADKIAVITAGAPATGPEKKPGTDPAGGAPDRPRKRTN